MLNPDVVGRTFVSGSVTEVTQSAIDAFAQTLCLMNQKVAPATFAITITLDQAQELLMESGLDWSRVVHGDQKFENFIPIIAGMSLRAEATIESVRVAAGNEIASVKIDLRDEDNKELITSTVSTLVVRA
jgi:hypothetical protein